MSLITENFTGADATLSDGDSNRTITLSNTNITESAWFTVFVSGLSISITTDYTVAHNSSGTVITFLNALFDDMPIIVNYQTGVSVDIASSYCTSDQVAAFLQVPKFDGTTAPTETEVEEMIVQSEDEINQQTMNSWKSKSITNEYHTIGRPEIYYEGVKIFMANRNVTTLTTPTDKLEVWTGVGSNDGWEDYLVSRTEGRNNDYWVDEQDGIIWIRTYPRYLKRKFNLRITYRFGEPNLPGDIQKACIRLTAIAILQSDDKSILMPEGSSNIPLVDKTNLWQKEADKIIQNNRELKIAIL